MKIYITITGDDACSDKVLNISDPPLDWRTESSSTLSLSKTSERGPNSPRLLVPGRILEPGSILNRDSGLSMSVVGFTRLLLGATDQEMDRPCRLAFPPKSRRRSRR